MTLLALTAGDTALIDPGRFWGLLVLGLCVVLLNTFRVLESTKMTIDTMREETVPLLREVKGSVERPTASSTGSTRCSSSATEIVGRVEKLSGLVEQAAASPLVKIISVGAGLRKARPFAKAPRRPQAGEARVLGRARPRRRRDRRGHGQPLDQEAGATRGARRPSRARPRAVSSTSRSWSPSRSHEGKQAMDEREARAAGRRRLPVAPASLTTARRLSPPVDCPAWKATGSARRSCRSSKSAGTRRVPSLVADPAARVGPAAHERRA